MSFAQHLQERGLSHIYKHWSTGPLPNNPKEEHVVFPLVIPTGKNVGHQRYFWRCPKLRNNGESGRYITTILPEYKYTAFYGWDNCCGFGPLFITEGIWDAIRVSNCWVDCVAILCNSPSKQLRQYLRMIANGRPLVGLLDSDGNSKFESFCDYVFYPVGDHKDFNDMPHDVCFEHITNILSKVQDSENKS